MRQSIPLFFVLFQLVLCADLPAQIGSDYASNADGWTAPNANPTPGLTYNATGGNPGGMISATPFFFVGGSGNIYLYYYFIAPGKFTGNRSTYYGGTLRYDVQQATTNTSVRRAEVMLRNATDSLYYFPATPFQPPASPSWTTFSVKLNNTSGSWKVDNSATAATATEAEMRAVLTGLLGLEIRGLYRDANVSTRIDNVTFMPPVTVTQQPVSTAVCQGAIATLTTAATGNANIAYRWQRETSPSVWADVSNTGGYSGATSNTLSINTTGNFGSGNYRVRISGTAVEDEFTSAAVVTINALPSAPSATGSSSCGPAGLTLVASGGAAGQYRWYTSSTGGVPVAGQTGSNYTTPLLSVTTTFYVAVNNGTCESARTPVVGTIDIIPSAPGVTGGAGCSGSMVTLTASGGAAGQYRWYTAATGGSPDAAQTSNTFTTPSLSATTQYHVAINNGTCESTRTAVTATINTTPSAPSIVGSASCTPSSITLSASGGAQGQYRWYTVSAGGTSIPGETNSSYATPVLTVTTTYYVSIHDGTCESSRTAVTATINTTPSAPSIVGSASCTPSSITLSASGGAQGQYRWYTVSAGGTSIPGETNSSYATPVLTVTTTYYVSIHDGTCESPRSPVDAIIAPPGCDNDPPVIETIPLTTQIDGVITLSLADLISDSDSNLDLSTLTIISPPASGASATIDNNLNLVIDYKGISFSGTESIALQVCDEFSACVQETFSIEVVGEIVIFNALSPNDDNRNEIFFLEHIEKLSDTRRNRVTIFNRWGDLVWEGSDYDNLSTVFRGKSKNNQDLPSGTYFYKIEFPSGRKMQTGYLSLRR